MDTTPPLEERVPGGVGWLGGEGWPRPPVRGHEGEVGKLLQVGDAVNGINPSSQLIWQRCYYLWGYLFKYLYIYTYQL